MRANKVQAIFAAAQFWAKKSPKTSKNGRNSPGLLNGTRVEVDEMQLPRQNRFPLPICFVGDYLQGYTTLTGRQT
ncbi:hypothetical protein pipiens_013715 [Culex pipiens pipiens]|uniref:Uncharacterized protein n=1 Tax=Culex pipiens pipiens TaxID=38569 RepID=A0ABD1CYJ9_CULPP